MRYASSFAILPIGIVALASCTSSTNTPPAVACGPDDSATTASDVVLVTTDEGGFFWASVDPIPASVFTFTTTAGGVPAPQAITAASAVAAAVNNNFPNSCASATANSNVVTFNLNNCSGPLGLTGASGTITATINTPGTGQVQVALSGNNITTSDGASLNLNTSATATINGSGQKTLQATSMTNGTGPFGNPVSLSGSYSLVWPTSANCGTFNGTLTGVGSGSFAGNSVQFTNVVACAGQCPQSGSATGSFNGGTVTLAFTGSNNAQCTSTTGNSATVALKCP